MSGSGAAADRALEFVDRVVRPVALYAGGAAVVGLAAGSVAAAAGAVLLGAAVCDVSSPSLLQPANEPTATMQQTTTEVVRPTCLFTAASVTPLRVGSEAVPNQERGASGRPAQKRHRAGSFTPCRACSSPCGRRPLSSTN